MTVVDVEQRRRATTRVLVLSALAALVYGGWAFAANFSHGMVSSTRAGLVQGASSATTTFVISGGIEALRARLGTSRGGLLVAALLPPTLASSLHVIAHWLVGTPEILRTILPSLVMGYVFGFAYFAATPRK